MIKMVSIFLLPDEVNSDEFWKYWKEKHVPDVKSLKPGLKKYTINRVKKALSGENRFWGLIETWWENEDDMRLTFGSLEGKEVADDFWHRVVGRCSVIVEEEVIIR